MQAGPFCDFGPALGDQKRRIIGRHLERAIRADVVVPVWAGLHGSDARWWRPKANPGLFGLRLPLKFLELLTVVFEDPLARERFFEPVEKLRSRVDLVVIFAFRKDRHLVQVLGQPGCGLRDIDEAILDQPGLGVQPHNFVAIRLVAGDPVEPLGNQFLYELSTRGLVLDQYDIGTEQAVLLAHRAFEGWVFEASA